MIKHWFLTLLVFISFQLSFSFAQHQQAIDSLKQIIQTSTDDTIIAKAYYNWGDLYWKSEPDTAIKYYQLCKNKVREYLSKKPKGKIKSRLERLLATALNDLGFVYSRMGNISDALDYYHESLKVLEDSPHKEAIAQTMNNLGFVYSEQENFDKALEYYNKSLKLKQETGGNPLGIATSFNNIGGIYEDQGNLPLAEKFYQKAYEIRKAENDTFGMSISLNNIGSTFLDRKEYENAYSYFSKSLKIQEKLDDRRGICFSLINLCNIHLHHKDIQALNTDALRAYQLSQGLGYPNIQQKAAEMMKKAAVLQSDYQKAYHYYTEEIALKDSITKELNKKTVYRQQVQFEYQKKAAIDSIAYAKELRIKESEQKRQLMQRNMSFVGMALALLIVLLIFRSNRQRKKPICYLLKKTKRLPDSIKL